MVLFSDYVSKRAESPITVSKVYAGFDPDLHNSGLALVSVDECTGVVKTSKLTGAMLVSLDIDKQYRNLEAVSKMIEKIRYTAYTIKERGVRIDSIIIESQQLYPAKESTRQALVAKGNDLIMLATISGAASAALGDAISATIQLPRTWKQQKSKTVMHARAEMVLQDTQVMPQGLGSEVPKTSHTQDALCMALTAAGYKV